MSVHVYVVEDDDAIRELIRCALVGYQYTCECFASGGAMLEALKERAPDLFLLDIMLPDIDGISLLEHIRGGSRTKKTPVIMLTAKTTEADKVRGLDAGANDYISKPFGILELMARIRAATRNRTGENEILTCGPLSMDASARKVTVGTRVVEPTLKEYELLRMLLINKGRVVTRERLLNEVWGYEFTGETRTLDMHIKTLRQKLGDDAEHPRFIHTVRGVGYQLLGEE